MANIVEQWDAALMPVAQILRPWEELPPAVHSSMRVTRWVRRTFLTPTTHNEMDAVGIVAKIVPNSDDSYRFFVRVPAWHDSVKDRGWPIYQGSITDLHAVVDVMLEDAGYLSMHTPAAQALLRHLRETYR